MAFGVTYVSVLLLGFVMGPVATALAGFAPFGTLHNYIGIAIAGLVVTGGSLGLYVNHGAEHVRFIHMSIQLTSLVLLTFQAATRILFLLQV